jgi:FkbM family methyltransferase
MLKKVLFKVLPPKIQFKIRSSILGRILLLIKSYQLSLKSNEFYSQFGEDAILKKYLKEDKGFYLDIGSGDPVRGSNTYFLYKKGWKGILIDPLTRNIFSSKVIRRKDKIIQGLVGATDRSYPFYEMYPYEYSTTNNEVVKDLINNGKAKLVKKVQLNTFSVSELNLNINLDQPSLLSVDCEGFDLEVLKTIDLKTIEFRIICVEDFDYNPAYKSSTINQYLNKNGYEIVDRAGPSSIYVKSSWLQENLN